MEVTEALNELKIVLSDDRYEHTLRVLNEAEKLAEHFKVDKNHVQLATIFHDYAKEMSPVELKELIKRYELDPLLLQYHEELWHGPVASQIIQERFAIKDEPVVNAIYYHTTGRAQMDKVELTLFVADYIEPARSFPGLDKVRETAFIDLEKAALLALKNTIPYLISKGATIFPDTFYAYNDLLQKISRRD